MKGEKIMFKIKLFDEPIKTEGYCEGVDLLKLFDYETNGYLLLKYKYSHEKDFEEDVVLVEYDIDKGHWIFENDYWEGQEEVYIMGYINHHYNWNLKDILKIGKLLNENEELKEQVKIYKKEVHNLNEALKKQQKDNSDAHWLREDNKGLKFTINHLEAQIKMLSIALQNEKEKKL